MAMKKRPQGKFVAGKVEAPRKITIRGETHYLVYVTPEEAKGLKKAGGTGEAGPKGIPAFRKGGGRSDRGKSSPAPKEKKPSPAPKPAPRDRDDRQPTPAPKSTPAPAPKDRDDRQPTPAPAPKTLTRSITAPAPPPKDDGPSAAEKKVSAYTQFILDKEIAKNADAKAKSLADATAKSDAAKAKARVQSLADAKERAKAFADAKAKSLADAKAKAKAEAEAKVKALVTTPVVDPKGDTTGGVAGVKTNVPFKGTMKDGVLVDRLGNPVVTNKKGYGYLDPLTGLAVTPWTDSINGGGPGYGGAAFGSGGGAALDTNKDNYISEAEIAAGKAKGLALEQNAISKIGTGLGVTPLGSGIDPTGIAGLVDPSFIRKLGTPAYTRPDSSIAPGQELNKWWEADKNALGFAYGTQDEISQRRADAVRAAAAAAAVPERNSDNDNGPVAPTVPTVTTPPTYTANAQQAFMPIPNPDYNPADPMSLAYLTNPSYEELLAYRNSGPTLGMLTGFTRQFAKGGIANLVKDGGNEKTIISDAIRAVEGKMSERDAAISLAKFVKAHGEPALRDLVDKVSSGEYADTRERFANGENGMVRGPGNGSGTDDKVPATIDGEQDVLLADGEMVLRKKTTDAIEKAYPGLLDRINAAEGDAPKVLAKALDFIEGRNRRG
jgi:hypothetical protein